MTEKKSMLTGEGLKKLQDELQDLEVVQLKEVARRLKKQENRAIYQKMPSMMLQEKNREILFPELKRLRKSLRM